MRGKRRRAYYAPFDVRLFEDPGNTPQDVDTVLQPDLMVVCDQSKVDRRGIHGAPDLVIEILSESTRRNDRLTKFRMYQRAAVKEYWIVDPASRTVSLYTLEEGAYNGAAIYTAKDSIPVGIFEDCAIDLGAVFPDS